MAQLPHVVIVGGGISGLACAHVLQDAMRVTLLEEAGRLGGQIATERDAGYVVEGGADSIFDVRGDVLRLCRDLGLDLDPVRHGGTSVLRGGRLHSLPPGLAFGLPTRWADFLKSGLMSWRGKLRMGLDLLLPRRLADDDESLGSFLRRRLGQESVDAIGDPLLAGFHLARSDELSLRATFPRFHEIEREHRSVILGLRRTSSAAGGPSVMAPRAGMAALVDRMRASLKWVDIRTREQVRAVEPDLSRPLGLRWLVRVGGETLRADAVVAAVPARVAGELVEGSFPALAVALRAIRHRSSATVSFGFPGEPPIGGTGVLLPPAPGRRLAACTIVSRKFDGRSPEGTWLVRCFLREAPPDADEIALNELRSIAGTLPDPVFRRVFRWPAARPVYDVGHAERIAEIQRRTPRGLHLVGSAYRGGSVPDCIRDGRTAAERIIGGWGKAAPA